MGIFSRKNKIENEYNDTFQKINRDNDKKAIERTVFKEVETDKNVLELVDQLKEHCPVVVNFSQMNYENANKNLAFLSGATYALNGEIVKLKEQVYLFAQKEDFMDGSLQQFISDL